MDNKRFLAAFFSIPIFLIYYISKKVFIIRPLYIFIVRILSWVYIYPYHLINHREYVKQHPDCSLDFIIKDRISYTTDVLYSMAPKEDLTPYHSEDLFIGTLYHVKIHGNSNFILDNDYNLINEFGYNMKPKFVNIDSILFRQCGNFALLRYKKKERYIPTGIMLVANFSNNYYHFLYEVLVKFWLLKQCDIPEHVPVMIDCIAQRITQFRQLFDIIYADIDRTIIFIEPDEMVLVGKLYTLSSVNNIPPHIRNFNLLNKYDFGFDINALNYLRNKCLTYRSNKIFYKKIFLSRRNIKNRSYNEEEIISLVKRYGFMVISPENFSIYDQIALFSQAEAIIGASGAALSDILFCNENCKIICLQARKINLPIFSVISGFVNAEMRYCVGHTKGITFGNLHADFKIDIKELESLIQQFGLAS